VLSSSFHQGGSLSYGRDSNPTWEPLEEVVGALEGGEAVAFASGMAAIAAVLTRLPAGAPVVYPSGAYSGTRRLIGELVRRGEIVAKAVDVTDTEAALEACRECPGGLMWVESPTNPLLGIADIAALCEGAHRLGVIVVVDNTFATPLLQRPLDLGADVVVHSATKLLAGHSDVLLGLVVSRDQELLGATREVRSMHGAVPGPFEAWLVLRGVRTLSVRLEKAQTNAAELAKRLAADSRVTEVMYPGLESHCGHELAARQMSGGFGTMISFVVAGTGDAAERAETVVASTRLATAATSLGGVETLIERRGRWAGEEALPPALIRLSVGIEDLEDLWSDLDDALSRAGP
jgi:cystathionine gamma-synthase